LIHRIMPPFHQRRADQCHAGTDCVDGNNVESLKLVRGKLPKLRSQQI
jgi:hypothetical protein